MNPVEFDENNDDLVPTLLYKKEAERTSFSLTKLLVRSGLAKSESGANAILVSVTCICFFTAVLIAWNMMSNNRNDTIITPEEEFRITPLPIT